MACNQQLTSGQRALCAQWEALSIRDTRRQMARYRHLWHYMDEVRSVANEALCHAARTWQEGKAAFPLWLRYWVSKLVREMSTVGSQVVRIPRGSGAAPTLYASLSVDTRRMGDTSEWTAATESAESRIAADESPPEDAMDAERAVALVMRELPGVVAAAVPDKSPYRERSRQEAPAMVDAWLQHTCWGADVGELAQRHGVTKQGMYLRLATVQRHFETWAREIREEG